MQALLLDPVQRTRHAGGSDRAYVRVNHRRLQVLMPQQLLDRANVLALFQQVSCKAVSQRVRTDLFAELQLVDDLLHRTLHGRDTHRRR